MAKQSDVSTNLQFPQIIPAEVLDPLLPHSLVGNDSSNAHIMTSQRCTKSPAEMPTAVYKCCFHSVKIMNVHNTHFDLSVFSLLHWCHKVPCLLNTFSLQIYVTVMLFIKTGYGFLPSKSIEPWNKEWEEKGTYPFCMYLYLTFIITWCMWTIIDHNFRLGNIRECFNITCVCRQKIGGFR